MTEFRKNTQISNFVKIRLVEAELFHAGGADGYEEANSRFSQLFRNVPKRVLSLKHR